MDVLPHLPSPFPQLDFPVTEGLRQDIVKQYRAMLVDLQADINAFLDSQAEPVVKSFANVVADKQEARRHKVIGILRRLGVAQADFAPGGRYENTSDEALRELAKQLLAQARKERPG